MFAKHFALNENNQQMAGKMEEDRGRAGV